MGTMKEQTEQGLTAFREHILSAESYLLCTPAGRVRFASSMLKMMLGEDLNGRNLNDFLEDALCARLVAETLAGREYAFRCRIRQQEFRCTAQPWEDGDGIQIALVNPWNFVPDWYKNDTVEINSWQYIDARCYDALMELLQACRDAGYKPYVASAFRKHEDQIYLYNRKIQRLMDEGYSEADAKRLAGTVVAVPGTSEHELGLAVDLTDNDYRDLDEDQEKTATQKWLMENSWRYGFILRYPSSKSEATGIIYEPWHYRYVGKATAKAVYESGLCLEEYFESER